MKKSSLIPFATMGIGMGLGAYLYSYSKKHPMKTQMAINKVKNMMKDFQ